MEPGQKAYLKFYDVMRPEGGITIWIALSDVHKSAWAAVEAACAPQDDVATALRELLDAYSFYFPPGNPWGDKARKALGIETPSAPEGHDPTNPFAPRERPQKSVRLMTDAERRAAGLDPNGGFDGPTGAD